MLATIAKSKWSWLIIIPSIAIFIFFVLKVNATIKTIDYVLTPPELPDYEELPTVYTEHTDDWGNTSSWYHHAPQGTATLPVPHRWLMALEEPKSSPWLIWGFSKQPFVKDYMLRMGFIKGQHNEDLPIGLAKTASVYFEGIDRKAEAVGFTCAACHTGQLVHNGTRYVIDGGPSMADLGLLTESLGAALGQTALSSKIPMFDGRFDRFAHKVLGSRYSLVSKAALKKELSATLAVLAKGQDAVYVTEGYTRLDALNRIGNQVFAKDLERSANYSPIQAPVNYPHIWNTPWFDWVQYDGSIMQPMIRNAGEALGVAAKVQLPKRESTTDFIDTSASYSSSVAVKTLHEIEEWIAGSYPFTDPESPAFDGLASPRWPSSFPALDTSKVSHGEALYQELCQGCHLPPVDSQAFWREHWSHIQYTEGEQIHLTDEKYLHLKIIPLDEINTDPAQAHVLMDRTVDTTGMEMATQVCTPSFGEESALDSEYPQSLEYVDINDSSTSSFALALGAVVQLTNAQWFRQNGIPEEMQAVYEGGRPNCLQAGAGYKARPLNGVWATAPFLHNGSIATLYDLLSTQALRPRFVELGGLDIDTQHVGVLQSDFVKTLNARESDASVDAVADYQNQRFILDTKEAGNHNTGHLFDDEGITIGRKLTEEEKLALIEYLKTQ